MPGRTATEQRIYGLNAWRETPFYTGRERAALEWTEHLTLIADRGVPDELYARVREHFSEEEIVHLTLAVVQNGYNRFAISSRAAGRELSARAEPTHRSSNCISTVPVGVAHSRSPAGGVGKPRAPPMTTYGSDIALESKERQNELARRCDRPAF
jgi:hypothetical protein